jgi:hypothetical protein
MSSGSWFAWIDMSNHNQVNVRLLLAHVWRREGDRSGEEWRLCKQRERKGLMKHEVRESHTMNLTWKIFRTKGAGRRKEEWKEKSRVLFNTEHWNKMDRDEKRLTWRWLPFIYWRLFVMNFVRLSFVALIHGAYTTQAKPFFPILSYLFRKKCSAEFILLFDWVE